MLESAGMADEGWRFLGASVPVRAILARVSRVVPSLGRGRRLPPILLQGETGTGKGLLARTIHETGPRASGPFVAVNCAAIPASLIEAELFGFERGAFTDARQARTGLVEAAHGGTLFLDEIGLMPEGLQAKLLTVLETREVRPLGGTRTRVVDASIVTATNSDLRAAVRDRRFREDLYHRLAVLEFTLPPLRERGADVLELAEAFLARACADHGLEAKDLAEDARAAIFAYRWPGNVRELANVMERVALLAEERIVRATDLDLPAISVTPSPNGIGSPEAISLKASLDTFSRARVEQALTEARGNVSAAAERLGVARSTLRYQIERLGLASDGIGRPKRRITLPASPLSERLLAPPEQGERRQITILFADFRAAMDRLAGRDPEATRRLFDPVLDRLIAVTRRHEGSVNHVRSDGLMALFGAPTIHEDHAVRACYAALAMRESVGAMAEGLRAALGSEVRLRIGLHSGDVVLRMIGDEVRLDYAAIPETTNLAARMEQAAQPGAILVTAATARLAEGFIDVASATPPDAYELRANSAVRSRLGAAITRGLTRFVGRDVEVAQLDAAMSRAREGRGQVVTLVGEPGVGKSRLTWEVARTARAQDWLVLMAGCLSAGVAPPYLPLADLLRSYFQIGPGATHEHVRETVTGRLREIDESMVPLAAPVLATLDVPVDEADWQQRDAHGQRRLRLDAVLRLILRASLERPVLLVVDDVQWIDSETQAFLDLLVESLPAARLLLLVNGRPETLHSWSQRSYYAQVALGPLPSPRAAELLDALVGTDPSLEEVKKQLLERTEGNPLFVEESVRSLVETGALVGSRKDYRPSRAALPMPVPERVQSVLAARIGRLAPDDRRVLLAASAIGKDVPLPFLELITDQSEEQLRPSLRRLQAAELLYATRLDPSPEYAFKHALTHEVAYQSLPTEIRRQHHEQFVKAIESRSPAVARTQPELLAHHAVRGELWDTAARSCMQAGARSAGRVAYREALGFFEQASRALAQLPDTPSTRQRTVDVLLDLAITRHVLGQRSEVLDCLRRAEALAEALDDRRGLGEIAIRMASHFWYSADPDRALEAGRRSLACATDLDDPGQQARSRYLLAEIQQVRGDYRDVIRTVGQINEIRKGAPLREEFRGEVNGLPAVTARSNLALALAELGSFAEATACAEEACRMAEAIDRPSCRIVACLGLGGVWLRRGEFANAVPVLESGFRLCEENYLPIAFPWIAASFAYASGLAGRVAEARALLQRAIERAAAMRVLVNQSQRIAWLGELTLLDGCHDEAIRLGQDALELARAHKERGHEAWALRLLGQAHATRGVSGARHAEGYYRQALEIADERGMRPLQAKCHLGLGRALKVLDGQVQPDSHLMRADEIFRQIGMRDAIQTIAPT